MADADNKFSINTPYGDSDWASCTSPMGDEHNDFAQDSAGFGDRGPDNKTNMDMALKPNTFPRQTGHDSLTAEEAQLS